MKPKTILPREKFKRQGLSGLTDADLVALLLGTGTKNSSVFAIAKKVVAVLKETRETVDGIKPGECVSRLRNIPGIGGVKALEIAAAMEFGRRLYAEHDGSVVISSRDDVLAHSSSLKKLKQEHVLALYLDSRNKLLQKKVVAVGSLNVSIVEPRDVFSAAIRLGACRLILVHNHPSGSQEMSGADVAFTKRIEEAGKLLGIELVDHVVV